MTHRIISPDRIAVAKLHLQNVDAIAAAAQLADISFAAACTYAQHETGGFNVYGHDAGGIFSTGNKATGKSVTIGTTVYPAGSMIPCTPANGALFLYLLGQPGSISNGFGVYQITYRGYFPQMLGMGLVPWVPVDNAFFALSKIIKPNIMKVGHHDAFGLYNGGPDWKTKPAAVDYADTCTEILHEWRERFRGL